MKKSLLSLLALAVILSLFSCSKGDDTMADAESIEAIQQASNKQTISEQALPAAASTVLNQDFSESVTDLTQLAPELGYELLTRRVKGTRIGERTNVYFNMEGRRLRRDVERPGGERPGDDGTDWEECFDLVYPVTFIMPDETEITGDTEEEIGLAMRIWYADNPDTEEHPELQYPVDIEYGTTATVNSNEEMRLAYGNCE